MVVKIGGKDKELKFTFNSFKYMGEFDLREIQEVQFKPMKIFGVLEVLLMGALNSDPKELFQTSDVQAFLTELAEDESKSIGELLTELMGLLEASNFFKSLQRTK